MHSPALEAKLARAGLASNPTVRVFGERYFKERVVRNWKDPSDVRRYLERTVPNGVLATCSRKRSGKISGS